MVYMRHSMRQRSDRENADSVPDLVAAAGSFRRGVCRATAIYLRGEISNVGLFALDIAHYGRATGRRENDR